jgi:hypothetical protein
VTSRFGLTVFSGDASARLQQVLPEVRLPPGGFKQITEILRSGGLSFSNGYVRVERTSGTAPYYAYAVINDQRTSDGSFVTPQPETEPSGNDPLTLPVVVETDGFSSEVIVTNWFSETKTVGFQYIAEAIDAPAHYAQFQMDLKPGEQTIIPNFVQFLRQHGVAGVQKVGPTYAGVLYVDPRVPLGPGYITDPRGVCVAARTSSAGGGGRYGLFYSALTRAKLSTSSIWFHGLQQDAETRSNLALINTEKEEDPLDVFRIELFDGGTGQKVNTIEGITLGSNQWMQINRILADYAPRVRQGYARVTPIRASTPFIAYAVINDGSQPGERTGDGAFISSSP